MEYDLLGNTLSITVVDNLGKDVLNNGMLKEARNKKSLSINDVADFINKSYDIVWCYETGSFLPNGWYDLKHLCLVLEISSNDIFDVEHLFDNEFNNHIIVQARKRKEYSIRTLSSLLCKGTMSAHRYEHDDCIPESWITLKKLCRVLEIQPDEVLGIKVVKKLI